MASSGPWSGFGGDDGLFMCGIAGVIGPLTDGHSGAVERMTRAQVHRGPDDQGLWRSAPRGDRGVVLGHQRLAILDLSPLGHQPMVDEESGAALVYNGEIYNYRELRGELEGAGTRFRSTTDTEVLLHALLHWGDAAVARLRGMFSFAFWDPRREEMLLVRDRMGIKPLYWARAGDALLFASELRALLSSGLVERRLDPVGLSTFLWNGVPFGPRTIVRGVSLLPAATWMRVRLDGRTDGPSRYWSLPGTDPSASDTAGEELRASLADAVRMRLVADVPLGVFLSGGVDSSVVAALAQRASDRPIRTFNIGFDEAEFDESAHARRVAEALGTDHVETRLTGRDFKSGLGDALRSLDQPTFDAVNTYFVSRAVREAGLTVALAGTGGDELFGGYASFRDIPRARHAAVAARPLPPAARQLAAQLAARLRTGRPGEVRPQTRWGKLADVLDTGGGMLELYQVSYALFTRGFQAELRSVTDPGGTHWGIPEERAAELDTLLSGQPDLHAVSMMELSGFLGERLLRDTDTSSMAVSLEVRVPLIDHRVVEALARVPVDGRFHPLGGKHLLRSQAEPELSAELFDRPKAGFVLPLERWCREELRDEVHDTLTDVVLCDRVGLHAEAVGRLWRTFRTGSPAIYWSRVWALFVLLWWCREHAVSL